MDYEDSSPSTAGGLTPQDKENRGQLITLNLDLGSRGFYVLHGLTSQTPTQIARKFCHQNGFGPKTAAKIEPLVAWKLKDIARYQKIKRLSEK